MTGWPRSWRRRQLAGAVGISALLLLLPAMVATGGSGLISSRPLIVHTAAGTVVQMSVGAQGGFVFTPDAISNIAPGSNVTLEIRNLGSVPHTFTLSSAVNYTLPYSGNTNLTQFLVQHPAFASVNITDVQGQLTVFSFTAPTKIGSYQFFCQVSGHFPYGMEGLLGVGIVVGPQGAPPGVGLPVFIISGVIVGLVIAAIVAAFVVGKREGSTQEMPPERLGYPETPSTMAPPRPPY